MCQQERALAELAEMQAQQYAMLVNYRYFALHHSGRTAQTQEPYFILHGNGVVGGRDGCVYDHEESMPSVSHTISTLREAERKMLQIKEKQASIYSAIAIYFLRFFLSFSFSIQR